MTAFAVRWSRPRPLSAALRAPVVSVLATALVAALTSLAPAGAIAERLTVTVQDSAGKALENAVVSVMVRGARERAAPDASAEMAQRDRSFVPQVLVVQTGTPVLFPNLDTVRHHVYSFSAAKTFEIKLYVGTPTQPILFDKPGTAILGCNIHDKMVGFIHVVDTPYFGRTGTNGVLALDLPAGEHRVRAWHPVLQASGAPVQETVRLAPGSPAAMTIRLSGP